MKRPGLWSLLAIVCVLAGCDIKASGSEDPAETEDGDSAKKKKKKKKDKEGDGDDAKEEEEALDLQAMYGKDAAFGGVFSAFDQTDASGLVMFGATNHSPIEPPTFSAGWVGQESAVILRRAKDGDFTPKQVRTSSRRHCLVFLENNVIRRSMIATKRGAPTEEYAYSQAGHVILWYRHNRKRGNEALQEWAYFHRGSTMTLTQRKEGRGARNRVAPFHDQRNWILKGANECIAASGASNPRAGVAPAPAPVPAPQPVSGGGGPPPVTAGLYHGALAYSESGKSWRITYRGATLEAAKSQALAGCNFPDCKIVATFSRGQCMSIVHGPNKLITWGWANENHTAQAEAVRQCTVRKAPVESCKIYGTYCNDR